MKEFLWLIPTLPFAGALILILVGPKLSKSKAALIGSGSVGLSALLTILVGVSYLTSGTQNINQTLWVWIEVEAFKPAIAFHLDQLSLVFIFVITFVGFLIHIYSTEFMAEDASFGRFFAYLNLFVGCMLVLVLADNLLLMYLGWEGVGLCSYLLIGFWYQDEKNGYAARKAFIVTRVGDTAMAIALFMLFQYFGTLNIQNIVIQAPQLWTLGAPTVTIIALLLLGGAVGKSAQLPLQVWLPDAMAGPSPVSALIHAATMVTAGVYLIARTHVIFELAPFAQFIVSIIGALTLLLAGFSALTQYDLKRILAYSTISQIGYMFLALGVGAWSAAIFHFMIHAFFKALLFLGAGAIIMILHHEHNIFKMGGLKEKLPIIYWTFLIGSASLAAVPIVTGGFYSKDQILWLTYASERGNVFFYLCALIGAFITSIYTFRMVFITFYGASKTHPHGNSGLAMTMPLIVLAILSTVTGFIELPHSFGHITLFSDFLLPVLPSTQVKTAVEHSEWLFQIIAAVISLSGIYLAYLFYLKQPDLPEKIKSLILPVYRLWQSGWGFDAVYNFVLVKPFVFLSEINKRDVIDKTYSALVTVVQGFNLLFSFTQSGIIRWYIIGIVLGAIATLTISLLS